MSYEPSVPAPPWRAVRVVLPLVLLVVQVVGSRGAATNQPDAQPLDAWAYALLAAGPLALLLIGRFPRAVLLAVGVVTSAYVLGDYPYGPVFASFAIAVVVVVARGHRWWAWGVLAAAYVVSLVTWTVTHDRAWSWPWATGVLAWMLVLAGIGELIALRRARTQAAREARAEARARAESEERLRVARDLHDVVAHHISLINVQAQVALHLGERKPEQAQVALTTIRDASAEALAELRDLIGVLRTGDGDSAAPRAPVSRLATLDELARRASVAGLDLDVRTEGRERALPEPVELAAYRILQEAVTNVVRHSGAARARATVAYEPDALVVTVDDDGRGDVAAEGSGLRGMRERASALGGSLAVERTPSGGVAIRATLPYAGAADAGAPRGTETEGTTT